MRRRARASSLYTPLSLLSLLHGRRSIARPSMKVTQLRSALVPGVFVALMRGRSPWCHPMPCDALGDGAPAGRRPWRWRMCMYLSCSPACVLCEQATLFGGWLSKYTGQFIRQITGVMYLPLEVPDPHSISMELVGCTFLRPNYTTRPLSPRLVLNFSKDIPILARDGYTRVQYGV